MSKFQLGDEVMVRKDLITGVKYHNEDGSGDIFTSRMRKYRGKEATIIGINNLGYELDIDDFHTYTESMLQRPYDELAMSEYLLDPDVERVIGDSLKQYYKDVIDKALDERMFETDPEGFKKIIDMYNIYS